ncbi:hypothetical protein U9R90_25815 [Streptomyces sp. E11-3]|uniref:hypothetical protein n=1 Tax=Streptomyces sp. E11-3 TaxID=3110112 RepID=UPI00398136E8
MSTEGPENDDAPARRRIPLTVASVAAAVLLVGGGGAYLATTTSGDGGRTGASGPSADASPPPLDLDGHTERGTEPDAPGIAPGEPDPSGTRYRADGKLPDGPDAAPVYRARGEVTKDQVARLAAALNVKGTPRLDGTAWKVGQVKDGSGHELQVHKQAPGSWTYAKYFSSEGDCSGTTRCAPVGGKGLASMIPPVSEGEAKAAARPLLKAIGQDDAKLDARQTQGRVRVVNADPVIGGLPTHGWATSVQVSSEGKVFGANGRLTEPEKGATYPVLDADETLKRLNTPAAGAERGSIAGCASAVPHDGDAARSDGEKQAPCEPGSDMPVHPKPPTVVVDDAVFGLAAHFERGRQILVPSWLFEVKPDSVEQSVTITHPAVDPEYLQAPAKPSPEPTKPTDPTEPPEQRDSAVESYSADGRTLTLHFWGGVCSTYSASAEERGDRVVVKITETTQDPGRVCIMIAKELTETVTLDKPLGDREVVDTKGATVPRT